MTNMMMSFLRMRPLLLTEDSVTGPVEADASLRLGLEERDMITAGGGAGSARSLALGQAAFKGCEVKIANETEETAAIQDGAHVVYVEAGDSLPRLERRGMAGKNKLPCRRLCRTVPRHGRSGHRAP
jgi:hypothetical protein